LPNPLSSELQKENLHTNINFNGTLTDPQTLVATAYNRSLRYGDGLFETMYWDGDAIQNPEFHLDRLFQGLGVLRFDLTGGFTRNYISEEIKRLCQQNVHTLKARVRLNVYREEGAFLLPVGNKPVFIIESAVLTESVNAPLNITVYRAEQKSTGILSNLKTNNYLLNILALQYAKEGGFDDALILNNRDNICEASSSNLFTVQKGVLYTPALTEGCVAGTKRRELLETLPVLGFQVEEKIIPPDRLFEMEEVFLTNAVRGICPVKSINGKRYRHELTDILIRLMMKTKE
jgi:branched-chain amino acid aminotransferase